MSVWKRWSAGGFSQTRSLFCGCMFVWLIGNSVLADELHVEKRKSPKKVSTSYCGLHCVYAIVHQLQPEATIDPILKSDFISGPFGSTANNLIQAFETYGVTARFHPSLSIDRLKALNRPVILHVRPVGSRSYSHWILFLGFDGNAVRVFDPPSEQAEVSPTDLLSVWSGGAVVPEAAEFDRPETQIDHMMAHIPVSLPTVGMIVFALCLIGVFQRKGVLLAVVLVTVTLLLFTHAVLPTGFLYGDYGVGSVQASFFQQDIPGIGFDTAKRLSGASDVVFVDARTADAYERFHLPNAVNIPVDSTYCQLVNSVARLEKTKAIVFYCQSDKCHWADSIANQVLNRGFTNISIYRGGVKEWQKKHER